MVESSTWKYVSLMSAFALVSFGSVWYGPQAMLAAGAPRDASRKPRLDAAFAVKRAGALLETWKRDKNRAHLDEALDVLERARSTGYGKPVVLAWLGYVRIERGEYAESAPPLKEAILSHPKTPAPYIDLAYALNHLGQYSEAAGYLKTAASVVPADSTDKDSFTGRHDLILRHIYFDLGGVSVRAQQPTEAVQAYRQAEALNGRVASISAQSRGRMDARLRDYSDEDEPRIADGLGRRCVRIGSMRRQSPHAREPPRCARRMATIGATWGARTRQRP